MTRIALLAYGTRGDFQPMIALASALSARGHQVVMTANEDQVRWVARSGVTVIPTPIACEEFLQRSDVTRALASGDLLAFSRLVHATERAANDRIVESCRLAAKGAELVLSTATMLFRGAALAEWLGVPHAAVLTVPLQPTRAWASMLSPLRDLRSGNLNRLTHVIFYAAMWRLMAPSVHDMRAQLGLPRSRRRTPVEHLRSVQIYSPLLAPPPADLGAQHRVVGAIELPNTLRMRLGEAAPPPGLEAFLMQGEPPVFFGFGSMPVLDRKRVVQQLAEVARKLGVRALIGAGWSELQEIELPSHVFVAKTFDHDRVLPRCRAAVHHGGAGTTVTALRAGLPSLVAHVNLDQSFWGWRVEQLGAGRTLPFHELNAQRLERELRALLNPSYARKAGQLSGWLRAEDGLNAACEAVETFCTPRARRARDLFG